MSATSAATAIGASAASERYARVIRQDVRSMHAYAIQPSEGLVKLDAMENPFRLPEVLQKQLGERKAEYERIALAVARVMRSA